MRRRVRVVGEVGLVRNRERVLGRFGGWGGWGLRGGKTLTPTLSRTRHGWLRIAVFVACGRGGGGRGGVVALALSAGVFFALAEAGSHSLDLFGEGVVVLLMGAVVALCGGGVVAVVVVVTLLLVFSQAAELVAEGGEAGLQAVVELLDAGQRGGAVLGEVLGVDGGGGVLWVVDG